MSVRSCVLAAALALSAAEGHARFLPETPFTNDARGLAGASFLKLPIGARPSALAESYSAVSGDADCMFWNPAGLARLPGPELTANYDALLETAYVSSFALGLPVRGAFWGLSGFIHSQSPVDSYDALGDPTGNFTPYDLAVTGAWARAVQESAFGIAAKVIHQKLESRSAVGWALDLGYQRRNAGLLENRPVDFGVSVRNVGAPITLGPRADPLPLSIDAGFHWRARPTVSGMLDVHLPSDDSPFLSLGGEVRLPAGDAAFALRGGYTMKTQGQQDGVAGFSAGGGVDLDGLRADYAWVPAGSLGTTHRMTLGIRF